MKRLLLIFYILITSSYIRSLEVTEQFKIKVASEAQFSKEIREQIRTIIDQDPKEFYERTVKMNLSFEELLEGYQKINLNKLYKEYNILIQNSDTKLTHQELVKLLAHKAKDTVERWILFRKNFINNVSLCSSILFVLSSLYFSGSYSYKTKNFLINRFGEFSIPVISGIAGVPIFLGTEFCLKKFFSVNKI